MINLDSKIVPIKQKPFFIFKVDNFFEDSFYLDIKKLFYNIDKKELNLTKNFGRKYIASTDKVYNDDENRKIFRKLDEVLLGKNFFNFFVKKLFLKNVLNQNNYLRKIRYLRYPIMGKNSNSLLDNFFSKIEVDYSFSYIMNRGGIAPHVDAQRRYISLILYFPDNENNIKESEYGTTFWINDKKNFKNEYVIEDIEKFRKENKILVKSPFVSNCLYGFLRNDFSWHTVEPIDVHPNYIRKSLNISFIYTN